MGLELSHEEPSSKYNTEYKTWDTWRLREEEHRFIETYERKRREEEDRAYEERLYRIELEEQDRQRRMSSNTSRI